MTTLSLLGGEIVDSAGSHAADVAIDESTGCIIEVAAHGALTDKTDRQLDVVGCVVAPGLVDLHAHIREPGDEAAETMETASRAAALGGYTAVLAMPDTTPPVDNAAAVVAHRAVAEGALCELIVVGALSAGLQGATMAPMSELSSLGVTMFSDCGDGIQDLGFLRRLLEYGSDLRTPSGQRCVIAQRCDVRSLSAGAHMHEGEWSARLGIAGSPAAAEELAVAQCLALSALTSATIHLQHVSTATSFELVRRAKADGVAVTADISPHHLVLTDQDCATFDSRFKFDPPLRTQPDVDAARLAVSDGTIDAIATGHAPHNNDLKERPFDQAPSGAVGLEQTLGALLTHTDISLADLLAALSWRPAAIAGLVDHGSRVEAGRRANLAVIDRNREWTADPAFGASRSTNTPFAKNALTGKIRHTLWNGELVVENYEAKR